MCGQHLAPVALPQRPRHLLSKRLGWSTEQISTFCGIDESPAPAGDGRGLIPINLIGKDFSERTLTTTVKAMCKELPQSFWISNPHCFRKIAKSDN